MKNTNIRSSQSCSCILGKCAATQSERSRIQTAGHVHQNHHRSHPPQQLRRRKAMLHENLEREIVEEEVKEGGE